MTGWRLVRDQIPVLDKAVLIFAPHTSNWDFVIMLIAKFSYDIKVRYLGKHSLFYWPYGWFFRALGGMPVNRSHSHNLVDQVVAMMDREQKILLALAPEGTRSYTPYWKTGFYHIAWRSKVPIVMFYLNTTDKTIDYSEPLYPTGHIDEDFDIIADFYRGKTGFKPELASPVQTKHMYFANKNKET